MGAQRWATLAAGAEPPQPGRARRTAARVGARAGGGSAGAARQAPGLFAVEADAAAGGADVDDVAGGAGGIAGAPGAALLDQPLAPEVVHADPVDPDLAGGRPRQEDVDQPGR